MSVDPVGGVASEPQSWNRYAYTLGNPLKYTDPDGLAAIDSCSNSGSDEERAGSCEGTIDVIGKDPDGDYDPLTGYSGYVDLVSGSASMLQLSGGLPGSSGAERFNSMARLPESMQGMTFRDALNFAVDTWGRGQCASDPNCIMLARASTALENPLLQTIQMSQEVGLAIAFGAEPAARTLGPRGAVFGRGGRAAGGILNSNDLLRMGFSWEGSATAGRQVFRIAIGSRRLPFHYHIRLWPF